MDPDTVLFAGLLVGIFALPAAIAAFADGRRPFAGLLLLIMAGGLIWYAVDLRGAGYTLASGTEAFYSVIGRIVNGLF